jgi:fatty acid synthase subunit beta
VGALLRREALALPVLGTERGVDLRAGGSDGGGGSLVEELLASMCTSPLDWPAVVRGIVALAPTHVLDCGPGGAGGAAKLTSRLLAGAGIPVFLAAPCNGGGVAAAEPASALRGEAAGAERSDGLLSAAAALCRELPAFFDASSAVAPHWARAHGPRLVSALGGAVKLDTAFSRLTGRPPVMIAGMTPTTSLRGGRLVAAALNAGFHAELACGGLPRPDVFRERIAALAAALEPGHGIGRAANAAG